MKYTFLLLMILVGLPACESGNKSPGEQARDTDTSAVLTNEITEVRSAASMQNDFNALESLFGNQNYLIVNGKDSSYFYFSRLGTALVKTYSYKIIKGDSSQVEAGVMQPDKENNIVWKWKDNKLKLTVASPGYAKWASVASDSVAVSFLKRDERHIEFQAAGSHQQLTMQQILPLSLFLVRSQYDYLHGTRLAFDTNAVEKK